MVPGTKNFFLSISGRLDRGAFSQITGILSGYLPRILLASLLRFSKGTDSANVCPGFAVSQAVAAAAIATEVTR
eukprot:CAMPEP_0178423464 /NCGR_PEP_ID=MMETSP0689_2-20121128/27702_1 /TAXON_ID=160604 /ORGANISM="Amphidinium massartii, Strain CS-259" /LENGTH=73 /DNA_ID=CAMNT_0020045059 /DNA_START=381 /DNA_END=602 /DNA_ORIENTATION=+